MNLATISVALAESLAAEHRRRAATGAEAARTPMPFAGVLRDHLLEAIAHGDGDGDRDWSAVAEVIRRRAAF